MARPSGERDDSLDPRCRVCGEQENGQAYRFWAGTLVSEQRAGDLVKYAYRDLKTCSAFVCAGCAGCARGCARRSHLVFVALCGVGTAFFAALATYAGGAHEVVYWALWGFAALNAHCALRYAVRAIRPGLSADDTEEAVLEKLRPALRLRGLGDSFFTQGEYRVLFRSDAIDAESAEEILGAGGRDDDSPIDDKVAPVSGATKLCLFCRGAIPSYAAACPKCREVLP